METPGKWAGARSCRHLVQISVYRVPVTNGAWPRAEDGHTPVPAAPVDAIGYVRVSLAREDMISPDIQKAAQIDWARRNGRRIVRWIVDLDATGRNLKRKIMQGVAAIEAGEAAEISVYRYDRWGRNAADSLANAARVEIAAANVVSVPEPLDPETSIGRYNRTNSFALAEMQSDIIGDNWKAA